MLMATSLNKYLIKDYVLRTAGFLVAGGAAFYLLYTAITSMNNKRRKKRNTFDTEKKSQPSQIEIFRGRNVKK